MEKLLQQMIEQQIITNQLLQQMIGNSSNKITMEINQNEKINDLDEMKDFDDYNFLRIDQYANEKCIDTDEMIDMEDGQIRRLRKVITWKYGVSFYGKAVKTRKYKGKNGIEKIVRNGYDPKLHKRYVGVFHTNEEIPENISDMIDRNPEFNLVVFRKFLTAIITPAPSMSW